jgi:hypothetical protein
MSYIHDYIQDVTLNKENILIYFLIFTILLYMFTTVIKIELSHTIALIITVIVILVMYDYNKNSLYDVNKEMEYKMYSLVDNKYKDYISHMYLDPDLIELFYYIRLDFKIFNITSYLKSIKYTNEILKIKKDVFTKLDCKFKESDTNDLDTTWVNPAFSIKDKEILDKTEGNCLLDNCVENFEKAEYLAIEVLNNLHSFIITIPSNNFFHKKHKKLLSKAQLLLYRNLDEIKEKCETNKTVNYKTKFITDYIQPKPITNYKHSRADDYFNIY